MAKSMDEKVDHLKRQGALNRRASDVTDPAFSEGEFFDPRDLVQVKYEMVRRVLVDRRAVSEAARSFGFSRPSFYEAKSAFEKEGLCGLLPKKRGPRGGHKLTSEVVAFVIARIDEDAGLRPADLVSMVEKRFSLRVHARSIERAVAREKKKKRQ